MKNIFKSHVTCGLTLSLLCLGGSVQAVNMASLFRPSAPASVVTMIQKKSFFASHPVLTYSGIGVLSAVVLYTTSAVYRAHRNADNLNVNKSILVVMKNDWNNIKAAGNRIASWFRKAEAKKDADKTISTGASSSKVTSGKDKLEKEETPVVIPPVAETLSVDKTKVTEQAPAPVVPAVPANV